MWFVSEDQEQVSCFCISGLSCQKRQTWVYWSLSRASVGNKIYRAYGIGCKDIKCTTWHGFCVRSAYPVKSLSPYLLEAPSLNAIWSWPLCLLSPFWNGIPTSPLFQCHMCFWTFYYCYFGKIIEEEELRKARGTDGCFVLHNTRTTVSSYSVALEWHLLSMDPTF